MTLTLRTVSASMSRAYKHHQVYFEIVYIYSLCNSGASQKFDTKSEMIAAKWKADSYLYVQKNVSWESARKNLRTSCPFEINVYSVLKRNTTRMHTISWRFIPLICSPLGEWKLSNIPPTLPYSNSVSLQHGGPSSRSISSSGRRCPDVPAKLMPVLRHSACRCHSTKHICDVFLPSLSWLSSASFPSYHSFHHCLLQTIVACNVAKVFQFLTSFKIIQLVRW